MLCHDVLGKDYNPQYSFQLSHRICCMIFSSYFYYSKFEVVSLSKKKQIKVMVDYYVSIEFSS